MVDRVMRRCLRKRSHPPERQSLSKLRVLWVILATESRMGIPIMLITSSQQRRPVIPNPESLDLVKKVSADRLRNHVERLAFPRSYSADRPANRRARDLLIETLQGFGYAPVLQGSYDNIVVACGPDTQEPCILLGAHYDSVPGTPGADDNASAVALCLECARLLGNNRNRVLIVLFNREEDGLLGSKEFVEGIAPKPSGFIREAHIFEMVGFRSRAAGSQRMPLGLPLLGVPDIGNFLGLLANQQSNASADRLLSLAATYLRQTPVLALNIYIGVENVFGHLLRSDHASFWEAGIPAVMWTDTAEFRNPHYHRASDTPETLDYDFLVQVTQLALVQAVSQ
jgi:hypothetical protein